VTSDIERALQVFREVYGVERFVDTGARDLHDGQWRGRRRGGAGYVGDMQFEIIEPIAGAVVLALLPADGSHRRFITCRSARCRDEVGR
jgi:hypothetical protein